MEKIFRIRLPVVKDGEITFPITNFTEKNIKNFSKTLNLKNFPHLKALRESKFKRSLMNSDNNPTERVIGKLFLANQESMENDYLIKTNKITAAVGVMKFKNKEDMLKEIDRKIAKRFKENAIPRKYDPAQDFLKIEIDDLDTEDISRFFIMTTKYIEDRLKEKRNVVIFCNKGLCRSPTVILAYLIWKFGFEFDDAYHFLIEFRGLLKLNKSFQMQLIEWSKFCKMRFMPKKHSI